ncbi:MAG TPA: hypothetical protein VMB73_15485 [Acetobacteraceae bacterium]|nr:hypothetical protein [Acetobacteraceae bacterium]
MTAELDEIIESIERGDGVPDAHYRAGIDRDNDLSGFGTARTAISGGTGVAYYH